MIVNFRSLIAFAFFVCFFELVISTRYYVDSSSSISNGTGTSWSSPFQFLEDALSTIGSSTTSNEIWIAQGIYYPQTTDRESCFKIPQKTMIYGGFLGTETSINERNKTTSISDMTILDGDINTLGDPSDNCYHVIDMSNGILDSIVIRNGNANKDGDGLETNQLGGGLYVGSEHDVNITLINVQIINNTAHEGGGIYGKESENYITILNSRFENNVAVPGTYLGGYGGAIHVLMAFNLIIKDTEFIQNSAVYRGGAIYQDYGATVWCDNCIFTNNAATSGHGGAWFGENRNSQLGVTTGNMNNSIFSSNYAFGYGGGCTFFTQSNVNIRNTSFDNNIANSRGGGITFFDITNISVLNVQFSDNTANDSSTNEIYVGSFPDFTSVNSIPYNQSDYLELLWDNRMITTQYNDDLPDVNASNLCYVKQCQGCNSSLNGSSWDYAYSNIQDCIDKLEIIDSTNKEIWVATGTYYPTTGLPFVNAILNPYFFSFVMSENIRMYGGFKGNETLRSQRNWYMNPTILSCDSVISCTIIMDAADNVIVDGFIFTGALYNQTEELTGEPTTTSTINRRLLQNTHSTLSIELTDITGGRGGGIFSNGTNITVVNSLFYGNLAVKGGGLYCIGYAGNDETYKSPTITNVAFVNNVAERGGAIMGDVYCEFECNSCIFEDNVSSEKGGAIYLDYFCDVSINNSVFINNVAYESGGCIANDGFSYVLANNDTFIDNEAKWEGGCLYGGSHLSYSGTIFYIENSLFENNSAYYGFDDIWLWQDDGIIIKGTSGTPQNTTQLPSPTTSTSVETTSMTTKIPITTTPITTELPMTTSKTTKPKTTSETKPPVETSAATTTTFKNSHIIFVIMLICFI